MVVIRPVNEKKERITRWASNSSDTPSGGGAGTATIKSENIVSGGGQVAVSGGATSVNYYGETGTQPSSQTTSTTEQATTTDPAIKDLFQGKQTIPVSPSLASKLSGQSLRDDTPQYVSAQKRRAENVDESKSAELSFVGPVMPFKVQQQREREAGNYFEKTQAFGSNLLSEGVKESKNNLGGFNPLSTSISAGKIAAGVGIFGVGKIANENIKVDKGNVYFSSDLLVGAGSGLTTLRPGVKTSGKVGVSASEQQRFNLAYEKFTREEGITPGTLVTERDALKIQDFMLKYNRENQATSVVLASDKRLVKTGGAARSSSSRDVGVELKLQPVEGIEIFGKTENLGGVQRETRYMVVKKGQGELVDLSKVEQPDIIYLEGKQTIKSGVASKVEGDSGLLKLDDKSGLKLLPGGNMGSLTESKSGSVSVSRNVRDVVTSKTFGEQLNVVGGRVEVGTFLGRLDTLDFSGAKVFKMSGVKQGNFGLGTVSERTTLGVRGVKTKLGSETRASSNFPRIGRSYKGKYNINQIEDMRNRIEYVDKKSLTADNIREVTEVNGGYYVKLYTWDGGARAFRNVEAFIPKTKTAASIGVGAKVTTATDIINKNKPVDNGVGAGVGGQEQVLANPETIKVKVNVATLGESIKQEQTKSKAKVRVDSPKMDYAVSTDSPKYYYREGVVYNWGGKVYMPEGQGVRVATASKMMLFGGVGFGKYESDSLAVSKSLIDTKAALKIDSVALVDSKVASKSATDTRSLIASRVAIDTQQISQSVTRLGRFRFENVRDTPDSHPPRGKIPEFDLNLKGNNKVFGVQVKRFGSFRSIGEGMTQRRAIDVGVGRVRSTAGASFQVTRLGKPVLVAAPSGFYRKGETLIESQRFRINSPGELREISYEGVRKQRRKNLLR